jgi:hypothetical protein
MADNTIQFGITLDASTLTSDLTQVKSAFQSTTSSVSSQWSATSSTVTDSLKKIVDEAQNTAGRTKEHIDKASSAASALGDVVGIKVPEGMQKMLAESKLIGPALEAAMGPLAVIQLVEWIAEASDKLTQFIADTFIYTQAEKDAVSQIAQENKVLGELADKTKEAVRAKKLLDAPDEASRIRLKLQFEIADQQGTAEDFKKQIDDVKTKLQKLRDQVNEGTFTFAVTDDFGNEIDKITNVSKDARDAQAQIDQLSGSLQRLNAQEKLAEATKALEDKREREAKAAARAAAQERAAQAFLKGLDDQLTVQKQTHLVGLEEELHFWQSKLAAAAKYPEDYRTIQRTTFLTRARRSSRC